MPTAATASLWGLALIDLAAWFDLPLTEFARSGSLSSAFDTSRRQAPPSPWLLGQAALSLVFVPLTCASACLALASSFSALASCALTSTDLSRSHQRFVYRPISHAPRAYNAPSRWIAASAIAVVALWVATGLARGGVERRTDGQAVFPAPVPMTGSPRPYPKEAGSVRATAGAIPSLADWLAHRAFQEALPLERVGTFREDPFAPVSISRPEGTAESLRFDDTWARAAYRSIPAASVEGMLAAQGKAVVAEPRGGGGSGRPLAPIDALLYIFLLIPPLGRIATGVATSRGPSSREARQEA